MKKFTTILAICIVAFSSINAQTLIVFENWNKVVKEDKISITSTSNIYVSDSIGRNLSFEGFALASTSGFAEVYAGLGTYVFSENFFVSGSVGFVNTDEGALRLAGSVIYSSNSGKINWPLIVEWGPSSDYWYTTHLMYSLSKKVNVGLMGRRYIGVGPRVEVTFGKFTLWSSVNYDYEDEQTKGCLAVRLKFLN